MPASVSRGGAAGGVFPRSPSTARGDDTVGEAEDADLRAPRRPAATDRARRYRQPRRPVARPHWRASRRAHLQLLSAPFQKQKRTAPRAVVRWLPFLFLTLFRKSVKKLDDLFEINLNAARRTTLTARLRWRESLRSLRDVQLVCDVSAARSGFSGTKGSAPKRAGAPGRVRECLPSRAVKTMTSQLRAAMPRCHWSPPPPFLPGARVAQVAGAARGPTSLLSSCHRLRAAAALTGFRLTIVCCGEPSFVCAARRRCRREFVETTCQPRRVGGSERLRRVQCSCVVVVRRGRRPSGSCVGCTGRRCCHGGPPCCVARDVSARSRVLVAKAVGRVSSWL